MTSLRLSSGASPMKQSLMSNILNFERKLKEAGIGSEQAHQQAEATAELIDSMVNTHLATKGDIQVLVKEIQKDFKDLEMRLILRIGAIVIGSLGLISYIKSL
jgi:hypothetical protein